MITVAIQAGGASTRMGANKALIPFNGRPLIEHIIDQVKPIAGEILITSNHQEELKHLDVKLVSDLIPGRGVLSGLYTSLQAAIHPYVAFIACDMPFVSAHLIEFERDQMMTGKYDVVIPKTVSGYEPLHAVYRREECLPAVYAALCTGEKRLISWFDFVKVQVVDEALLQLLEISDSVFGNVNTIVDLKLAEQKWSELHPNG